MTEVEECIMVFSFRHFPNSVCHNDLMSNVKQRSGFAESMLFTC